MILFKLGIIGGLIIILFSFFLLRNLAMENPQQARIGSGKFPASYGLLPKQSDWREQGIVLTAGQTGSWDYRLHGMISPCTVIKKEDKYFLYYLGADGNRSTDMGPRHRAMGVAVSDDGIHFQKALNNPIITHSPQENEEEGVFSAGAMLNTNEEIWLYYGAIFAANPTTEQVGSNISLATSTNGTKFNDKKYVVDRSDSNVWGYGDELFPVGTYQQGNTQHVYYIAKGKDAMWDLGVVSISDNLSTFVSRAVLTTRDIRGGGDPIDLGNDTLVIPLMRSKKDRIIELRLVNKYAPDILSEPQVTYHFNDTVAMVIYYDRDKSVWYMYYIDREGKQIKVRTAQI